MSVLPSFSIILRANQNPIQETDSRQLAPICSNSHIAVHRAKVILLQRPCNPSNKSKSPIIGAVSPAVMPHIIITGQKGEIIFQFSYQEPAVVDWRLARSFGVFENPRKTWA